MTREFVFERLDPPPVRRMPIGGLPKWGTRVTTDNFIAEWNSPANLEVNVQLAWPGIVFADHHSDGRSAAGSDRLRPLSVGAGGFAIRPGNCTYRTVADVGWYGVLQFNPDFLARLTADDDPDPAARIVPAFVERDPEMQVLCRHYKAAMARGERSGLLHLESVATLVGMTLLRHGTRRPKRKEQRGSFRDQGKIGRVVEYIESGLDRTLSLSELAGSVGMGLYSFARSFKAATGQSPHQYVLHRRLERARKLLSETDRSIADIAYAVGFSSQSHMTDIFRRRLGTTPGRYRRDSRW